MPIEDARCQSLLYLVLWRISLETSSEVELNLETCQHFRMKNNEVANDKKNLRDIFERSENGISSQSGDLIVVIW